MSDRGMPNGHQSRCAIGLDVGGTKIAGGVVTADGRVIERMGVSTPSASDQMCTVEALYEVVTCLRQRRPDVEAIGVGAAGMVDWPSGRIRWAPNNACRDLPLREMMSDITGLPTVVDNDANVAAWAEARVGSGIGRRDMAVFTVGTGVGGGLVLGGQLYRGRTGIAAEFGHIIVNPGGDLCGCGNTGCLEAMAAGPALGRAGQAAVIDDPAGYIAVLAGGDPRNVTGETVFEAAAHGDPTARKLFEQMGYWLGIGLASVVNLLDVELVVIAGGLLQTGDLLLEPTRASFERFVFAPDRRHLPPIVAAHLDTYAGLIGAALLSMNSNSSEPEAAGLCRGGRADEPARASS